MKDGLPQKSPELSESVGEREIDEIIAQILKEDPWLLTGNKDAH